MDNIIEERPCPACGVKAGGNLRLHSKTCSYVLELRKNYPNVEAFIKGELITEKQEGKRKNPKHATT